MQKEGDKMNLKNYVTTALEDWVSNWYIRNKILKPWELKIMHIARKYGIYIHLKEMPARYDICGRYKAIVLDKRSTYEEQREQFFHELCHILRHTGHQSMMPEAFRQLQEWDAKHFTKYAVLPFHMLRHYDLTVPNIITILSEDFKVTEQLCKERLEGIKRNILYSPYSKYLI
jgi:Zn-dependent peptidase ImmA (M78 family)